MMTNGKKSPKHVRRREREGPLSNYKRKMGVEEPV